MAFVAQEHQLKIYDLNRKARTHRFVVQSEKALTYNILNENLTLKLSTTEKQGYVVCEKGYRAYSALCLLCLIGIKFLLCCAEPTA